MNYEALVREWISHYGGSLHEESPGYGVSLPSGMEGDDGEHDVWACDWKPLYLYLTTSVRYPATIVGPVPGGAR